MHPRDQSTSSTSLSQTLHPALVKSFCICITNPIPSGAVTMTLLQKINPFSRPPSRLSRNSVEHSARPSSSLEGIAEVDPSLGQGQTPTPAARANPSSDHVAIPLFQDPHPETALSNRSTQQRSQPQNQILQAEKSDLKRPDNRTLTPQPHTPRQHKKTPSILRSLAHHPSFSALKSKSRRRKEKEAGRLVGRSGSEGVDVPGASGYVIESGDLRGSRSVPGGLRLSEELGKWKFLYSADFDAVDMRRSA